MRARLLLPAAGVLALAAFGPLSPPALAHGEEEAAHGGAAEIEELAKQPARILAQQALAELRVRNDSEEAAVRLDAALVSKDKSDVDVALLRQATETLDSGDAEGAIPLLDGALSRPLGAASGKALHEAGREFEPATGVQEVVGIVAGAVLLLLGLIALAPGRQPAPSR